jgi:hypothetical protein
MHLEERKMSNPPVNPSVAPLPDNGVRSRIAASLEGTGKFAALFFGLVYALGFLVIAIHHAQYGISQFDPLRPKIFSTGLVFLVLSGLPSVAALRQFHVFGLQKNAIFHIGYDEKNKAYADLCVALSFWPVCLGLSYMSGFIFVSFSDPRPWGLTAFLAAMAAYLAVSLVESRYFNRLPMSFAAIDSVTAIGVALVVYHFQDHRVFFVSLWFYATGLAGLFLSKLFGDSGRLKAFEWEIRFPYFAAILLWYSTFIYENVRPSLGGGAPTSVALYLSGKSPVPELDATEVLLLEETDHGYYILRPGKEQTAYFLRRDLVSAIHFLKKDSTKSAAVPH